MRNGGNVIYCTRKYGEWKSHSFYSFDQCLTRWIKRKNLKFILLYFFYRVFIKQIFVALYVTRRIIKIFRIFYVPNLCWISFYPIQLLTFIYFDSIDLQLIVASSKPSRYLNIEVFFFFGTRYSALMMLYKFNMDFLKSFISSSCILLCRF